MRLGRKPASPDLNAGIPSYFPFSAKITRTISTSSRKVLTTSRMGTISWNLPAGAAIAGGAGLGTGAFGNSILGAGIGGGAGAAGGLGVAGIAMAGAAGVGIGGAAVGMENAGAGGGAAAG